MYSLFIQMYTRSHTCLLFPMKVNVISSSAISIVSLVLVELSFVCQFNQHFISRRYHIFITWQYFPQFPSNITEIHNTATGTVTRWWENWYQICYGLARFRVFFSFDWHSPKMKTFDCSFTFSAHEDGNERLQECMHAHGYQLRARVSHDIKYLNARITVPLTLGRFFFFVIAIPVLRIHYSGNTCRVVLVLVFVGWKITRDTVNRYNIIGQDRDTEPRMTNSIYLFSVCVHCEVYKFRKANTLETNDIDVERSTNKWLNLECHSRMWNFFFLLHFHWTRFNFNDGLE